MAQAIRPGRSEPAAYPSGCKPSCNELRVEIIRRDGKQQCGNWARPKCVKWLLDNAPVDDGGAAVAKANALLAPKPKAAAKATSGGDSAPSQRWDNNKDGTRLMNCILLHKDDFLSRDETVARSELQANKGGAKKLKWESIVKSFNDPATGFPSTDEQLLHSVDDLEPGHGLSGIYTGYVVTVDKAISVFKKQIRAPLERAKGKWNVSGNGDDKDVEEEDEEEENENGAGESESESKGGDGDHSSYEKRARSFVYSSCFKDYLFKAHSSGRDWFLVYAYFLMTKYDLFKSALSDMPEDATSSSSCPGSTSGGGKNKKEALLEQVHSDLKEAKEEATASASAFAMKEKRTRCATVASLCNELNDIEDKMGALKDKGEEEGPKYKRLKATHDYLSREYAELTTASSGGAGSGD